MENLRTRRILAYLKKRKECSYGELMAHFGVSSATIHRDVASIARLDAVELVRGGLVYKGSPKDPAPVANYLDRQVSKRREKAAAAKKALSVIEEGDIIFLDSSTTVYELALLLMQAKIDHLTVITNSIPVMGLFRRFPSQWTMISLGGDYDPQLNALLGLLATEQLSCFNITKAFVSAFGLDDKAVTTNHERQIDMLKKVLAASDRRFLILDHTKFGRKGIYRIAARGSFDAIFSD